MAYQQATRERLIQLERAYILGKSGNRDEYDDTWLRGAWHLLTNVLRPDWDWTDTHKEWLEACLREKRYLLLASRGYGKSTVVSECGNIWKALKWIDRRILILSYTYLAACAPVHIIQKQFRNNLRLKVLFGDRYNYKKSIGSSIWLFGRTEEYSEPNIFARGLRGNLTGKHVEEVDANDLVKDEQDGKDYEKLAKIYNQVVEGMLVEDGYTFFQGTRFGLHDYYSYLLGFQDENYEKYSEDNPVFAIPTNYSSWDCYDKDGKSWNSKRFPQEDLEEKERRMIPEDFWCQYRNKPQALSNAIFRLEWFGDASKKYPLCQRPPEQIIREEEIIKDQNIIFILLGLILLTNK